MGNRILSVVLGSFVAMFVIGGLEQVVPLIYPVPAHIEPLEQHALEDMIKHMPLGAFFCLLAGYTIGSFAGGFAGGLIARKNRLRISLMVGIVLLAGGIFNLLMLKHPLWFVISSLLIYLPAAHLGGTLAEMIGKKKEEKALKKE